MKIAVFCPNLIGDTVMATPTFRALRQGFPDATIVGVIKPQVAPDARRTPWFDDWIYFDRQSSHRSAPDPGGRCAGCAASGSTWRFSCRIRSGRAWLAWLAGIPRRVGYDRYGRGHLADRPAVRCPRRVGAAAPDADRRVLSQAGAPARLPGRLGPDSSWPRRPTTRPRPIGPLQSLGLGGERRVVCLNTGGAFGPAKSWPTSAFRRAGAATGRRSRCVDPGPLRARRARAGARDRGGGRPSAMWSAWPISRSASA